MSNTAFSLILFSALMHALWNLLVKRSVDKTVFIWWMFLFSGSMFSLVLPFVPGDFPRPDPSILFLSAAGGLCFVLYHLFNGRAYRDGDLSLAYPLAQTSMVYVPLWGMIFFGERLTPVGAGGIALVVAGAYCIQLRRLSFDEILRPFRSLGEPGVASALMAGFIYSVGAVIDKTGVMRYSPLYFTYLLVFFMMLIMTANLLRPRYRGRVRAEWRCSRKLILMSGPVMMGSFIAFRYGLQMAPVSYAVPTRQVSLLIGVLIGIIFLGERFGRIRILSALTILGGVFLIRLG
ncbi:MAG: EamA family transporter [Geoalkalibacter sp.]|jgi:drug/metabolite transporter (DMT)-like permease|uniref:EamA family transporter n=1 Tax=Geoalkalibacter sp. TaxID=3041440 RepID=UPI002A9704F9|nr:EamA family transporter [Thermodesulfobacteriota bacterium]